MPIRIRLSILTPNTDLDPPLNFSHFGKLEEKKILTAIHSSPVTVFYFLVSVILFNILDKI
jgi:hypothetical protein